MARNTDQKWTKASRNSGVTERCGGCVEIQNSVEEINATCAQVENRWKTQRFRCFREAATRWRKERGERKAEFWAFFSVE